MASTSLRFAGRALRRSIPRAFEEERRQALSLVQSPRLFSSDSVKPNEHSSSDLVAKLDNSGYKKHIPEEVMSHDEYMRVGLIKVEESLLRSGQKLDQIEVALRERAEKDKRDAMYAQRRAAFVGASVIVSGIAGLAFCAKKVLFG